MSVNQYRTMSEAIDRLKARGFTASFEATNGSLRALENGRVFQPEDLQVVEHHRFEGETNPEDMSVVYAVESKEGMRGIIVDAYGTYANPALGNLVNRSQPK